MGPRFSEGTPYSLSMLPIYVALFPINFALLPIKFALFPINLLVGVSLGSFGGFFSCPHGGSGFFCFFVFLVLEIVYQPLLEENE